MKKLLLFVMSACLLGCVTASVLTESEKTVNADDMLVVHNASDLQEGKPLLITAIGTGKDWVGIYLPTESFSLYYYYFTEEQHGVGSGVPFDMRKVWTNGYQLGLNPEYTGLPAGRYVVKLMDGNDKEKTRVNIRIKGKPLPAPTNVIYNLDCKTDGLASGTIYVTVPDEFTNSANDILMYWADADGKALKGFDSLAKFRIKKATTENVIPKGVLIPPEARKLLVYIECRSDLSANPFVYNLPENSASVDFGKPIATYNVCSDTHVANDDQWHDCANNLQFTNMLNDVAMYNPESHGIFIVGDVVSIDDNGQYIDRTWESYRMLYDNAKKEHGNLAPCYIAIGNHELGWGYCPDMQPRLKDAFCKNAIKPDGTSPESTFYDFWLDGFHFIFVGNDRLGSNGCDVFINSEHMEWLDNTIGENYDPKRPTFIFLHQALPDTVAGSLEGQGWGHVSPECEMQWREVLAKYPEAIMFNAHSHWEMNSERNSYTGDPNLPSIFNTGSTANEMSTYEDTHSAGISITGSEGYTMDVYKDKVVIRGRNYFPHLYRPSCYYCVSYSGEHTITYHLSGGINASVNPGTFKPNQSVNLADPSKEGFVFDGWFLDENFTMPLMGRIHGLSDTDVYAKWLKSEEADVPISSDGESSGADDEPSSADEPSDGGCGSSAGTSAMLLSCALLAVLMIIKRKMK